MDPQPSTITEAAGLLGSGAIFGRRVGLRPLGDPGPEAQILAGFKRGGFAVYFGDAPILHFDLDGRWQRVFLAGTHYLKGLDATVRAVDRPREGGRMVLRRRTLTLDESATLDARVAQLACDLRDAVATRSFSPMPPPAPARSVELAELSATLTKIAGWDASAWAKHQAGYRLAYGAGPPPFLPPDCPNPVILQPTSAMTPQGVIDHARRVAALLGQRLDQCRDVFLAGSGWIDRPAEEVLALLGAVNEVFPITPDQGRPRGAAGVADAPRLETIHGWLDIHPEPAPSLGDWSRFQAAHLGRITLRVDSRSPLDSRAIHALVAALKAAHIGVGLALFVDSAAMESPRAGWIGSLPLGPGDLVTLIAVESAGDGTPPDAQVPPDLGDWKARIVAALPPRGPRVAAYNPDKQWG